MFLITLTNLGYIDDHGQTEKFPGKYSNFRFPMLNRFPPLPTLLTYVFGQKFNENFKLADSLFFLLQLFQPILLAGFSNFLTLQGISTSVTPCADLITLGLLPLFLRTFRIFLHKILLIYYSLNT